MAGNSLSVAVRSLRPMVVQPSAKHTASLIFMHGSGDSAMGLRMWVSDLLDEDLEFPHIKIIYPNAPVRKYTALYGAPTALWFDRTNISPFCTEHQESIDEMSATLGELIKSEVDSGIKLDRIAIGGFSMGGAMALYYGLRRGQGLAGIFALSSFLCKNSIVYTYLERNRRDSWPPVYQCHGDKDSLVKYEWGLETHQQLTQHGIRTVFHKYAGLSHEMKEEELLKLKDWILERLPEQD